MSRYQPVPSSSSPPSGSARRSGSISTLRRPSISSLSSFRPSRPHAPLPDPDEMDRAFDGPDEDDDLEHGGETRGLLASHPAARADRERVMPVPGDYDFERDYTQPPSSSSPPEYQFPHDASNPAEGNTNGQLPLSPAVRPGQARHFLGGILPSAFLPRRASAAAGGRVLGAGQSGVFGNLAARPGQEMVVPPPGVDYVPELESKDAPPTYQAALRDAVPPYWDTTVVLPSSNSPFGPLHSSMSGDEILIDGMPTGNFFGFFWNLIVSFSFQFVGFLLTYVLHTTHAAKYGSRVGLGCTLIQFGFTLRSRAEDLISTGHFPASSPGSEPTDPTAQTPEEVAAEQAIEALWGPGSPWPAQIKDPLLPPGSPPVILHNIHEAEIYALGHNETLSEMLQLPSAQDVGRANEWFSFLLMSVGWFLILTSLGGWWRVKRFERGLRTAQRESEAAQAEAAAGRGEGEAVTTSTSGAVGGGGGGIGPRDPRYYTNALRDWAAGLRDIQRGFYGMRGRPVPTRDEGDGDEHELLDAQGFGLGPLASDEAGPPPARTRVGGLYPMSRSGQGQGDGQRGRPRGLWGV
ncbi:putative metal ion transport-related protein [Dioszegia hungarica]|uniref:Metal ion transport-related protein n=1 Tax=Dioszegia hungarica TaxID=4972 RepID=A0AA38HF59_9TREE|nr:putative metal ion transport-related protein [Dioszegia hungarica]KAI9637781.1 putative metal ion transport-related protein [Dioszegia hungarica]